MGKTLSVLGLFVWLLSLTPAQAARDFPQDARRGTLTAHEYPNYRIGTASYRLSPAGRIYNEQNLIIMPVSLPARKAEIMYRLDYQGYLSAIWLLTREEARLNPKQGNRPR